MSFWNLSEGDLNTDGQFDVGGGNIEPIPDNTQVLALIDEAKWDEVGGDDIISLRWSVMKPEDYKNRKIFQKVRVMDGETKKADKAKRMLAAIDANAGGKLMATGEMPTNDSMTRCLVNKPMVLKLREWKITEDFQTGEKLDEPKRGNWVQSVSPRNAGAGQKAAPKAEEKPKADTKPKADPEPAPSDDFGDDIPFD